MGLGYLSNFIHREVRSPYLYIEHRAVSILVKSASLRHVESVQSLTDVDAVLTEHHDTVNKISLVS